MVYFFYIYKKILISKKKISDNNYLNPDQIVQLEYTLGFSGKYCPDIKWATDHSSELLYASGSLLVGHNINDKK